MYKKDRGPVSAILSSEIAYLDWISNGGSLPTQVHYIVYELPTCTHYVGTQRIQ